MERIYPDIRVAAIDGDAVAVSFDSRASNDAEREVKVVRIKRGFTSLSIAVEGFFDAQGTVLNDQKEFSGVVKLKVTEDDDASVVEHVLAQPKLWVQAQGKQRKGLGYVFPSSTEVQRAVRQGVADALGRALAAYYNKEAHLDALTRAPARPMSVEPRPAVAAIEAEVLAGQMPAPVDAANDEAQSKKRHWRRLLVAGGAPLAVVAVLWVIAGLTRHDPIQEAVAKSMAQNPASVQAQVELTKQTLKEMGLDPGKAGDVGCLAPK